MSIEKSEKILNLQLEWVRTADTKVPSIFAINLAMLGVIAVLLKSHTIWAIYDGIVTALCLIPLVVSMIFLALSMFPRLDGPKGSNIFFGGITNKTEGKFIEEVKQSAAEEYEKDVLTQAYRNAEIATDKFKNIKHAFISSFISFPFWLGTIFLLYV